MGYSAEGTQPVDVPESTGPRHHIVLGGSSVEEYIYINKHFIWHVLAGGHFITLVIEVGELSTGSKVKGDFLLKIPVGAGGGGDVNPYCEKHIILVPSKMH